MRHRNSSLLGRNWKVLCANWVFTAVCWLLLTVGGQGQVYRFKTYTSSAGLPSNAIYHLYQDQKGYLWFSTGSGACRYDGVNYVVKSVEQGLADPSIRSVFEDHQGNFWIATQGGVNCITGDTTRTFRAESGLGSNETYAGLCTRDGTVWIATAAGLSRFDGQRFLSYGAGKLPPGRVWTLYEDRAGVLWIGIRGGGFVKAERLAGQAYPDDVTFTAWGREQGLPDANVFDFAEDPASGMWIATSGGLCLFDGQKIKLYSKEQGLTSPLVSSVLVDRHGRVWCGTFGGGLFRLENDHFINFNDINGLPSNYLTTLLEDGEGNLWCGTLLNGVFRLSSELFASYNTTGLTRGMVTGVGEASDGTLWVASMTTGLSSLSPSGEMRRYTSKDGILEENNLWCLLVDRRDRVWVGGYQGVSCFDGQRFVQFPREKMGAQDRITAIGEDRQGHIWFGSATSTSNGVVRYDGQTFQRFTDQDGLSSNQVSGIRLDQKGDIWFCTENGLTRYDGQRFQAFTQKDGLPSRRVRTLYQDHDGTYWVGTTDGLCRFDGTRVTQIFKEKEGLPGSLIRTIQRFDKTLWIGTQRGIAEFDGQQVVRVYSVRDGLVNDEIINNACLQRRDGSVWFGTTEGVVRYRVAQEIAHPMPPKVHLTGIRVTGAGAPNLVAPGNNQSAPLPTLDYDQNSLTFEFLGLTFLDETAVRYTYRLEPFDREWSAPSPERTARFTNLPPGRYRFAIKACSVRETWSEPQYFEITIRPPFWQTWWFRALSVAALITLISALYTWRIHALNQRQQQKLEHLRQLQEQRMMVMRQLLESIQVINSQLETTAVLQNIAEESARLVDGKPGGIGLVQDDRVVFKRQWVNGSWQAGDVSFQFGEGTPGKVARSAKAIIVNDPDDEPVSFVPEQARKNTSDGWMDVPILTRAGEVAAVLDIRHRPGRPPFTNEDISLIESLASQAAVAIENASLYGELE
ncbi:MAG TPA: two-component regulator propeller domain-containing protein, partial [Acidobacteriota bacterium]|nr:two-component regulator propeller domain-containing protein [Acidobacteriota bacterium]